MSVKTPTDEVKFGNRFLLDKERLLAKCKLCYEKVGTEKIMQVTGQNNLSFPRKFSNYDKTRRLRGVESSLSFAI